MKPETLLLLLLTFIPSDLPSLLYHAETIALLARGMWAPATDPRGLGAGEQGCCPPALQPRSPSS